MTGALCCRQDGTRKDRNAYIIQYLTVPRSWIKEQSSTKQNVCQLRQDPTIDSEIVGSVVLVFKEIHVHVYIFFVLAWQESVSTSEWHKTIQKAKLSHCLTMDIMSETAFSVLSDLSDEKQNEVLMSIRNMMPSELSDSVQYRLFNIILYELGKLNWISLLTNCYSFRANFISVIDCCV